MRWKTRRDSDDDDQRVRIAPGSPVRDCGVIEEGQRFVKLVAMHYFQVVSHWAEPSRRAPMGASELPEIARCWRILREASIIADCPME